MVSLSIQKINNNSFSDLFGKLYIEFSKRNLRKVYHAPNELQDYIKYVYSFFDNNDIRFIEHKIDEYYDVKENNKVLVAYSGGKDSLANVINLQNNGYQPILCYIKGINRSYPNEESVVRDIAKKLDLELIVLQIKLSGKCDYTEDPIKNAFILSMLVDYGKEKQINKYSFGNMLDDNAEILPKEVELSDGLEFFKLLEKFYSNYIKDFKIIVTLKNETYSYKTIIDRDVTLLDYTSSCMMPYRYLKQFHDKNEKKYNMKFKKNSCGCSCYKCCQELYTLHRFNKIKLNDALIQQCFKFFNKFDKENNTKTVWFDEEALND